MADARPGLLSVVATPIGNLGDLSPRAVQVLAAADTVLCEDTRHTGQLLRHLGLDKHTESLHAHNEHDRVDGLVERLRNGAQLALVSDAGTPCLSDPGALLVDAAHGAGIAVQTVAGPFAAAAALAASGLTALPFAFWGFFAKKSGQRQADLQRQLRPGPEGPMTHAFYVPGRDLVEVLADVATVVPDSRVCVARELTKVHESYLRGTANQVAARLLPEQLRGEAVLLVEIAAELQPAVALDVAELVRQAKTGGHDRKQALAALQRKTGLSRNALYALWLAADTPGEHP